MSSLRHGAVEVDILWRAGAANVFDDDKGLFADFCAAEVNSKVVVDENPDAFVFAVNDERHDRDIRAYLRRTFPNSAAVRQDRLLAVDNTAIQPGTAAAVDGVRTVAEALHR